jgi:penicillin amidase
VEQFTELQGDVVSGRAIAMLRNLRPELEQREGWSARELMAWDAKMAADSKAATVFATFMVELGNAVGGDEARRDGLDWNPIGPEELLRLLAGGLDESWWDDVGVSGVQTRGEMLDRVLAKLDATAPHPPWGDVHTVVFDHPLARFPLIGRQVSASWGRGPFAVSGNSVTINRHAWDELRPFTVTSIPALRFVAEVGNWDDTILVLPVGQSGRPWSAHYSDQIASWLNVEVVRFPFTREAVEAAAAARLELVPTANDESKGRRRR